MLNVLSILSVTLIGYSFSNYTYAELEDNLISNSEFNFSIFVQDPIGILIYGIDFQNKFLIEIEQLNKGKLFIFKINRFIRKLTSDEICECGNCSNIYITFTIRILQPEITIKCRKRETIVYLNNSLNQDQFSFFPKPKNHYKEKNKTSVWIGNIGYYIGDGNIKTFPIKNQMIGCVDKFYFNNEQISLMKYGDQVLSTCSNEYIEIHSDSRSRKNVTLFPLVNDCSISVINTKYCDKDLPAFKEPHQLFLKYYNPKSALVLKIIWASKYSKNFCLIELKFNESYYALFNVNLRNKISMTTFINNHSEALDLFDVAQLSNNVLLLSYQYTHFTIRVARHNVIKMFTRISFGRPKMAIIGSTKFLNICQTYKGALLFQHEITNPLIRKSSEYQISFTLEITAFVLLLLIVIVLLMKYKVLPQFNKTETVPGDQQLNDTNRYDYEDEDGG